MAVVVQTMYEYTVDGFQLLANDLLYEHITMGVYRQWLVRFAAEAPDEVVRWIAEHTI